MLEKIQKQETDGGEVGKPGGASAPRSSVDCPFKVSLSRPWYKKPPRRPPKYMHVLKQNHEHWLTSLNGLYLTFTTLASLLYHGNSKHRTTLLSWYCRSRIERNPENTEPLIGKTPLKEVFANFNVHLKRKLADLILQTPFAHSWGILGKEADPNLLPALKAFRLKKTQDYADESFPELLQEFKKEHPEFFKTVQKKVSKDDQENFALALREIEKHEFTLFSTNAEAEVLAEITTELLDLVRLTIPLAHKADKRDYHSNLFKTVFLYTEIAIPAYLAEDLARLHEKTYKDFLPVGLLFQLLYQTTVTQNYTLNLKKIGWNLGYRGSPGERYDYTHRYRHLNGEQVFESLPINLQYLEEVVEEFDSMPSKAYEKKKNGPTPYVYRYVDGIPCRTIKCGAYFTIADKLRFASETQRRQILYSRDLALDLPFQVRLLTAESEFDFSLKNSVFNKKRQMRLFCRLKQNPITKIPKGIFKKKPDNRWKDIFDLYHKTDFSPKQLLPVLKQDVALFYKLKPYLIEYEIRKEKLSKQAGKIFETPFQSTDELSYQPEQDVLDESDEDLFGIYHHFLNKWLSLFLDTYDLKCIAKHFKPIRVFKDHADRPNGKRRTLCQTSIEQKLFEKIANRIYQVIYQKINKEHFNYSVSNYLPGCAVPLYTMERFRDSMGEEDVGVFNLDVKSCFDNVKLNHPNFRQELNKGLEVISRLVSPAAKKFVETILVDYLYTNLIETKTFQFKCDKDVSYLEGSLPTGFVLAPAMWLTLTLPTAEQLSRNKNVLAFDLCGDDLIGIAPHSLSDNERYEIVRPYLELGRSLDLSFHTFKTYKKSSGIIDINSRWTHLFENNKPLEKACWIDKFPSISIPIIHAGVSLYQRRKIETLTTFDSKTVLDKGRAVLAKKAREEVPLLIPVEMQDKLSKTSEIVLKKTPIKQNRREFFSTHKGRGGYPWSESIPKDGRRGARLKSIVSGTKARGQVEGERRWVAQPGGPYFRLWYIPREITE